MKNNVRLLINVFKISETNLKEKELNQGERKPIFK
ncbi:hypothetical protein ND2E_3515 [Colwellia psychrerythraea]|uniref:Uncharacterized protein n=1 Tax=Colwellia psychrerythraea TaxID=28229 RepID=A0A099KK69_COLPS|nr:hypothetical protein ND2E_3515 [Colwellia psychrerythraea]